MVCDQSFFSSCCSSLWSLWQMTRETQLPLPAAFFPVAFPPSLPYFLSSCTLLIITLSCSLAFSPTRSVSTLNCGSLCCRAARNVYLWCLSRHLLPCVSLCINSNFHTSLLKTHWFPPAVCLSVHLSSTPHSIPPCLSSLCGHLLWGSLSPSYPNSAVPVGLWAGWAWAPAAFPKASPAAPATDPSNTATLTFIYTCNCRT